MADGLVLIDRFDLARAKQSRELKVTPDTLLCAGIPRDLIQIVTQRGTFRPTSADHPETGGQPRGWTTL